VNKLTVHINWPFKGTLSVGIWLKFQPKTPASKSFLLKYKTLSLLKANNSKGKQHFAN